MESNSHGQTIHELADYMEENAALKARVAELEKYKEFHSLVCTITATNFIKANAIREAVRCIKKSS